MTQTMAEAKLVFTRAMTAVLAINEDHLEGENGQFHIAVLAILVAQFIARFPEHRHDEVLADLLKGVDLSVKSLRKHMEGVA